MAQGPIAVMPLNGTPFDKAKALHEIEELAKIVAFRNKVLGGQHPKFKIPASVVGTRHALSPSSIASKPSTSKQPPANAATTTSVELPASSSPLNSRNASAQRLPVVASPAVVNVGNGVKSAINPILLEKSEDLIKAEIQLQRQRLERGLREQVEQRRLSVKAAAQSFDSLPDFDLSEVLFKALSLVHPSTTAENEPSVGARSSASDSFDENTFYSSTVETPGLSPPSQVGKETDEAHTQHVIRTDSHQPQPITVNSHVQSSFMTGAKTMGDSVAPRILQGPIPGLPNQTPTRPLTQAVLNSAAKVTQDLTPAQYGKDFVDITLGDSDAGEVSKETSYQGRTSGNSSIQNLPNRSVVQATNAELKDAAFPPSPRVFAHIAHTLSPHAPQPARVSSLIQSELQTADQQTESSSAHIATILSSPDTSVKGSRAKDRKKKKKKEKRKSTGKASAPGTPDMPYIKPEPRSPSPFAAAPMPRPHKRQRQNFQQSGGLDYDEPQHEENRQHPQARAQQNRHQNRRGHAQSVVQPSDDRAYEQHEPSTFSFQRQAAGDGIQYQRVVTQGEYGASPNSSGYRPAYQGYEGQRAIRAASVIVLDRATEQPSRYYREEILQNPRAIGHHAVDRVRSRSPNMHDTRSPRIMAPPTRAVQRRIVVDEYGRQIYETTPFATPVTSRQSVARYGGPDDEVIYERPIRAIPRAVADTFEEDGIIYRRASPISMQPPRRVITQPENEVEFSHYRQREYSVRPMAHSGEEYSRPIEAGARRQMSHFEGQPREFRVGSVRPENIRYEIAPEYSRVQSARPEPIPREYAGAPRPVSRLAMPAPRAYSVRPADAEYAPQDYVKGPPPNNGYGPQMVRRIVDEGEYMERPRQAHVQQIYQDGPREVIYR